MTTKRVSHRFHVEDRVVRGQPQFAIQDDPMQLPVAAELERRLAEGVVSEAKRAIAEALPEFWKEVDAAAQAEAAEAARKELLAQVAVLAELHPDRADLRARAQAVVSQLAP